MEEKDYRLEIVVKNGGNRYNLIKDIRFKNKKAKVRKTVSDPKNADIYYSDLELKAIQKKAELAADYYQCDYLKKSDLLSLEEKRWKNIEFFKSAPADEIAVFKRQFENNYIHGTTAVEGNTLSLVEVTDLLERGVSPRKDLREINEVQNYIKTRAYTNNFTGKMTAGFVKKTHSLVMDNILENSGNFRTTGIGIVGCDLQHTPPELIEDELGELIQGYYEKIQLQKHPFEQIMLAHYIFETIHPFPDGNGRVGREIMNFLLRKEKYPQFLIGKENREEYLAALHFGDEQQFDKMIETFYQMYLLQLETIEKEFDRIVLRK